MIDAVAHRRPIDGNDCEIFFDIEIDEAHASRNSTFAIDGKVESARISITAAGMSCGGCRYRSWPSAPSASRILRTSRRPKTQGALLRGMRQGRPARQSIFHDATMASHVLPPVIPRRVERLWPKLHRARSEDRRLRHDAIGVLYPFAYPAAAVARFFSVKPSMAQSTRQMV